MAPGPSPTLQPPAPLKKPPTPAQLAHRAKLKAYGQKGGLAHKAPRPPKPSTEAEAHESIKEDWAKVSSTLVKEALKAARDPKKVDGRSLVALTTAAGIAYDKRWSKQTHDTTEIELPASLVTAVSSKLRTDPAKPAEVQTTAVMVSPGPLPDGATTPDAPIDPLLLCPGG